jgi:hypothetical protein
MFQDIFVLSYKKNPNLLFSSIPSYFVKDIYGDTFEIMDIDGKLDLKTGDIIEIFEAGIGSGLGLVYKATRDNKTIYDFYDNTGNGSDCFRNLKDFYLSKKNNSPSAVSSYLKELDCRFEKLSKPFQLRILFFRHFCEDFRLLFEEEEITISLYCMSLARKNTPVSAILKMHSDFVKEYGNHGDGIYLSTMYLAYTSCEAFNFFSLPCNSMMRFGKAYSLFDFEGYHKYCLKMSAFFKELKEQEIVDSLITSKSFDVNVFFPKLVREDKNVREACFV